MELFRLNQFSCRFFLSCSSVAGEVGESENLQGGCEPATAAQAGTGGPNGIKGHNYVSEDFQHELFFCALAWPCIRPHFKGAIICFSLQRKKSGAFQKQMRNLLWEQPRMPRISRMIFDERHVDVPIAYDGMKVKL
jgi:hypothetical protein